MSVDNNAPVDPRVQIELEKLNTATDNINKFEVELDDAKCEFKRILAESNARIKQSAHKLGNSIEAAKPYYESRIYASQLSKETQQSAGNYEKAKSIHAAAKEMVYLAEQGLGEKSTLDAACQEMLSHATSKVNQSQVDVTEARNSLKMCQLKLEVANNRVAKLQCQLKAAIRASRPYYETRANYNGLLKAQKQRIGQLEAHVADYKCAYNEALKNLEQISEEIHLQRQRQQATKCASDQCAPTTLRPMVKVPVVAPPPSSCTTFDDLPCDVELADEYVRLPDKLSTNSSPVPQRRSDEHECAHLLRDFEAVLTFPKRHGAGIPKSASTSENLVAQTHLHGPYDLKSSSSGGGGAMSGDVSSSNGAHDGDDIEQWTEIRLSHSESTSSGYSNQSMANEEAPSKPPADDSHSSSSSDEPRRKVTCTTIFQEDAASKRQGLSQWLARSNSFKATGRRQSLDLLLDASDKVKDVFSFGFQRVGKTLERRNSESEMNTDNRNGRTSTTNATTGDFFLFSRSADPKDLLSDEQVENLLLNHSVDKNGVIVVEEIESPLLQQQQQQQTVVTTGFL